MRTSSKLAAANGTRPWALQARGRRTLGRLLALSAAVGAPCAAAIGLGDVTQQSELGHPLRVVIPVIAGSAADLAPECFKVVPSARDGDGLPEISGARALFERTGSGARVVVTTVRPVSEPAFRISLQAGCENVVRREFVLLLDPAPVTHALPASALPIARTDGPGDIASNLPAGAAMGTPAAASPAGEAVETAQAAAALPPIAEAPKPASKPRAPAGSRAGGALKQVAPPAAAAERRRVVPKPAAAKPATRPKPAAPVKAAPIRAPAPPVPVAAAPQPHLSVSSAAPATTAPGTGSEAPQPPSTQDATNALEAETIVLRERVAQLTELVDRMQIELRAAQAAQAARLAAEEAAKNKTMQTIVRRWWDGGWPIFVALVGLAALVAAGLSWKRRRTVPAIDAWTSASVVPADGSVATPGPVAAPAPSFAGAAFATTRVSAAVPGGAPAPLAAAATGPAAAAVIAPAPGQSAQSGAVDVSELSHVTEEAGVYLAFNRIDRAIEVLRDHIRSQSRSLPAAWLMLLDIYRTAGREAEFHELAAEYHRQFNAQAPQWDNGSMPQAADPGLEAFPHVMNQLVNLWGKPECKEFLELLLYDNRDGRRAGFSPSAYNDILLLRQIADTSTSQVSAYEFGGQHLRPAWAAAGGNTIAPQSPAAVPEPTRTRAPLVRTPVPAPSPPPPQLPPAAYTPAARARMPAALDLEVAFDEDVAAAAAPVAASRDSGGPPGPRGRSS